MNKWSRPLEGNRASAAPAGNELASVEHHYFAFLSYSHTDSADADWLHTELERFRVPSSLAGRLTATGVIPKRLTPIFRDRHELAAADDLGDEIREALAGSHCLIVLCSPAAATSKWTNAEIEEFKRVHPEACIIAGILAGEPFASEIAGREDEECFPPALRQKYDRRGRATGKRAEPLAADLREHGDGRRRGFLKIVAGMLGLGLDDLVKRDQLRKQRRLAGITAGSLAGMLVAGVLAVTAIQARDSARDQRREAEGLVAFMLGDLKDKLEPIGRLDALDGVGSRVLEYYSKQDTSELSDAGLLQRSRALSLTAQVAYLRGDLDGAERLYREAMAGTAEAIRRSPNDPQRLFDHAQNIFWIGEIARDRGQMPQLEAAAREYRRLAGRMMALEPDNLRWRMEGAYADVNIGIVYRNQRRFREAALQFRSALGLVESAASIDGGNMTYQEELANLLGWLADAERDQGKIDEAIRIRQRQTEFLRRLIADGMQNVEFRVRLVPAYRGLGILLSATEGPESGIEPLRLAVAEGGRLTAIEPDNVTWKGLAAQARLELSTTLLSAGRRSEADMEARAGCDLASQVVARDATWGNVQTDCLMIRSRLALASGPNSEAATLAERAVASARSESAADPITERYRIAAALRLVGDVHRSAGDDERAKAAWSAALAQLPRNVPERPAEVSERAELLKRLGRIEQARPLVTSLSAMGYRTAS